MKYFSPDFLLFLQEIEAHNQKAWFQANKGRYKSEIEGPFKVFVADLIDALDPQGDFRITARDCIFRIYKDARFSKDQDPYKTHVSALISRNGKKDKSRPGFYVQLSARDIRLYSGCFQLSSQQLESIRRHVYEHPAEFSTLIQDKAFLATFGEIRGEKYKRLPMPYAEFAKQQPLILNKSFYYFKQYKPEMALQDDLLTSLVHDYAHCQDLNQLFNNALGDEELSHT